MVIDEVIVEPLGFFECAYRLEAETFYKCGGAVIFRGDGHNDAVDFELGEGVRDHCLACGGHDAAALGGRDKPIGGKGNSIGPVDAVVPDDANELARRVDAGGVGTSLFAVAQGFGDEFLRVSELGSGVDPRQPSAKCLAIGVD